MHRDVDLVRLHEAKSAAALAEVSFRLFSHALPCMASFLILRPGAFDLPSYSSDPTFQPLLDLYIAVEHKHDIWMRRGPISPMVRVLRHTDHTPLAILRRSRFFKKIIGPMGASYGVSVMAWSGQEWLATLTLARTLEQGDFTDGELEALRKLQVHFESAVNRVALRHESKLGAESLEHFVWGLPMAAIVLSWDLEVLHFNAAAQDLCRQWQFGAKARALKNAPGLRVPGDIVARIRTAKATVPKVKPLRHNRQRYVPLLTLARGASPGLEAKVCFLPSKSLAVSRGTFLITLERTNAVDGAEDGHAQRLMHKLSRREREIIRLALQGKNSPQIGKLLGTSKATVRTQFHHVYQKLKVKSRYELLALFQAAAYSLAVGAL